jgi:hypothetical protein
VNLVVNARDAMPQGGTLTIETKNVDLDETYTSEHAPVVPGRYVMLSVADTGVGMSVDTREHAFDPFFTTKEAGKGTGLGLATVYGIVKQSGGYVWIYSEQGHGTSVKLYFPEVSAAAAFQPAEYKPATKEAARGSETLLLVQDEPAVGLASRILEKQGCAWLSAADGAKRGHRLEERSSDRPGVDRRRDAGDERPGSRASGGDSANDEVSLHVGLYR